MIYSNLGFHDFDEIDILFKCFLEFFYVFFQEKEAKVNKEDSLVWLSLWFIRVNFVYNNFLH